MHFCLKFIFFSLTLANNMQIISIFYAFCRSFETKIKERTDRRIVLTAQHMCTQYNNVKTENIIVHAYSLFKNVCNKKGSEERKKLRLCRQNANSR